MTEDEEPPREAEEPALTATLGPRMLPAGTGTKEGAATTLQRGGGHTPLGQASARVEAPPKKARRVLDLRAAAPPTTGESRPPMTTCAGISRVEPGHVDTTRGMTIGSRLVMGPRTECAVFVGSRADWVWTSQVLGFAPTLIHF
jgi:hypothetical protein